MDLIYKIVLGLKLLPPSPKMRNFVKCKQTYRNSCRTCKILFWINSPSLKEKTNSPSTILKIHSHKIIKQLTRITLTQHQLILNNLISNSNYRHPVTSLSLRDRLKS